MRSVIIGLGLLWGCVAGYMGYVSYGHMHEKAQELHRVEAEIRDLNQKISGLKSLRQRPAVSLDAAYVAVVNDMNIIARAHRAAWTMNVDGLSDAAMEKNAHPSVFPGLRELRVRGAFSGLARQGRLFALLDAMSAIEEDAPVLFKNIKYEKETLMFDLIIVGL
jgi:hypothetical protein